MSSALAILARVRELGANISLDGKGLRIVNRNKLPDDAMSHITKHRNEIARILREDQEVDFEERAAIIEFDGGAPREWAEKFAQTLIQARPAGVDDHEWTWFITACGRIIDEAPKRRAA